jgi:Ca2+-binding RTX toxin-like protein
MRPIFLTGGVIAAVLALPAAADAAYTAQVQGGTLKLTGDGASEAVHLDLGAPGTLVVDVGDDGTTEFAFEKWTFTTVTLNAGGGDDEVVLGASALSDKTVTLDGGAGNDTLRGGAGPETLIGGAGNDTIDGGQGVDVINGGSGNDRVMWEPGDGSDTIEGGSGTDTLEFGGSDAAELFEAAPNGARVRFTRNVGNVVMDLDDVEALALRTLGGADTTTVHPLAGTDLKSIAVDQSGAQGNADEQADNVIVNGTTGDDAFKVSAAAGGTAVSGAGATVTVTGNEPARDLITVNGFAGADTIASGTGILAGPSAVNFDGGAGADSATYSGTGGDDVISTFSNGAFAWVATPNHVPLQIAATERLTLAGGNGNDTFYATGNLAALTAITMDGGAGDDEINGSNGADTLIGGSGNDRLDGNQGGDTILAGAGNDSIAWDPGDGSDTVEGGSGTDTLSFNGSGSSELFELTANGARAHLTRNVANIVMDLDDTEVVNVRMLGAADTLTVNPLTGTDVKTVVGDQSGADGQVDNVVINGTAGDDAFKVTAALSGATISSPSVGAAVTLVGSEPEHDIATVNGLAGADTIVSGTGIPRGPYAVTFDGGAGTDKATYSGTSGDDRIDTIANGPVAWVASPGDVALQTTTTVEGVALTAGNGNDTFNAVGNLAALASLTMDGGAGDDTINGSNGADTLIGGSGNDVIDGNQGPDKVQGGSGNDRAVWDPGDGSDTIEGGSGTDTLAFNGSASAELFELSSDGPRVRFTRNIANVVMDLDDTEQLALRMLAGSDGFTVNDLAGTDMKTVDVNLVDFTGAVDGAADSITLTGTAGNDTFKVTRDGETVIAKGPAAQTRISGAEKALDTLRINTRAGDDTVSVAGSVHDLITALVGFGA